MDAAASMAQTLTKTVLDNLGRSDGGGSALSAITQLVQAGRLGVPMLSQSTRSDLTQRLLESLDAPKQDPQTKVPSLQLLKELSRLPGGSNIQAQDGSMKILLAQVSLPRPLSHEELEQQQQGWAAKGQELKSSSASSVSSETSSSNFSSASLSGTISRALLKRAHSFRKQDNRPESTTTADSDLTIVASEHPADDSEGLTKTAGMPREADWQATDAALRCLNNALYLHEFSRKTFAGETVGGARKVLGLLKNPAYTPVEVLFLAGRLLFYSTLFEATFNRIAVEEGDAVSAIAATLTVLTTAQQTQLSCAEAPTMPSAPTALPHAASQQQVKAAQAEILKVVFNLGLYYPSSAARGASKHEGGKNVPGEGWDDRLGGLIEPVLRLLLTQSTGVLASPATNAIGVLLNFPVHPYQQQWLSSDASAAAAPSGSPSSSRRPSSAKKAVKAFFAGHSNGNESGRRDSKASTDGSEAGSASFPSASRRGSEVDGFCPLDHLLQLLSSFLARYFPPNAQTSASTTDSGAAHAKTVDLDPDHSSVRALAQADGVADLEEVGQPLLLLLRKAAAEDDELRKRLKAAIFPRELDRSQPLTLHYSLTGRLVRLMSSILCPRLAHASGELLYAICSSDPHQMVAEVGYGPCAGWLVSNGLGTAMPAETSGDNSDFGPASASSGGGTTTDGQTSSEGRAINPITGAFAPSAAELASDPANSMTQEEKEKEAERLFVLFDRLNKTGVMKAEHPMREAMEKHGGAGGRFEEIDEEEDKKAKADEDEEEERAMKEFGEYKKRRQAQGG